MHICGITVPEIGSNTMTDDGASLVNCILAEMDGALRPDVEDALWGVTPRGLAVFIEIRAGITALRDETSVMVVLDDAATSAIKWRNQHPAMQSQEITIVCKIGAAMDTRTVR
jgi:hypothetical protein